MRNETMASFFSGFEGSVITLFFFLSFVFVPTHRKISKHLSQESSLLGNMAHHGLLNHEFSFLEFGAGRGGLTRAICLGLGDKANQTAFLLVDKAGNRNKVCLCFYYYYYYF